MKYYSEIRKFGLNEMIHHINYRINGSEKSFTDMYIQREKYYEKLNDIQLLNEIAVFYSKVMGRSMNCDNPVTFTEKIQLLKLFDKNPLKAELADKFAVRKWIKDIIGDKYLVPLIGVWNDIHDIDFSVMPEQFCIKMNHGSGMNYVVKNKCDINYKELYRLFDTWQQRPFEAISFERHYKKIERKVIVERYIEELSGGLFDYKFHCFNGKPVFVQCIGNRNLKAHTGYQNNYDVNWNSLDWIFEDYPAFPYTVPRPERLEEMVEVVTKLSNGFKYVRVDLYDLEDKVLFGEMTFTPGSGLYPYKGTWTYDKDIELGQLIDVSSITNELKC